MEPEGTGATGAGLSARVQLLEDSSWELGKHGKAWCLMRALERRESFLRILPGSLVNLKEKCYFGYKITMVLHGTGAGLVAQVLGW